MGKAGRWRMLAMGAALAVVLCVSAAAEEAGEDALEERCTGEWYWKLHPDGYAIVTGTVYGVFEPLRYEKEEPLVMPAELDGYPVKVIDRGAFLMEPWADLVLPEGLTTIRKYAFDETSITSVHIPSTVTTIEHGAFSWSTMPCFEASEGNPHYQVIDNMLITADGKDLIAHGAWGSGYTIVVPDGVETIGDNAFSCTGASKIILPDGVKTIEDHAFSDRYIDVNIPASVQSIGRGVLSQGNVTFDSLPQFVDAYSFSTSVSFRFTFLPEPETVYHFDSEEDLVLFFQTGDVSLLRTEEESEPVPDPAPDIEPEAPPPPKVEDEEPEVPEEPETPPTPEPSPAGWWVLAGAAALAAGWRVVRKIRPPKSGGHR